MAPNGNHCLDSSVLITQLTRSLQTPGIVLLAKEVGVDHSRVSHEAGDARKRSGAASTHWYNVLKLVTEEPQHDVVSIHRLEGQAQDVFVCLGSRRMFCTRRGGAKPTDGFTTCRSWHGDTRMHVHVDDRRAGSAPGTVGIERIRKTITDASRRMPLLMAIPPRVRASVFIEPIDEDQIEPLGCFGLRIEAVRVHHDPGDVVESRDSEGSGSRTGWRSRACRAQPALAPGPAPETAERRPATASLQVGDRMRDRSRVRRAARSHRTSGQPSTTVCAQGRKSQSSAWVTLRRDGR